MPRVWYRYAVEMLEMTALDVIDGLAKQGIQAAIPVTDWRKGARTTTPISDGAFARLVSLPLYPTLTLEEQRRVASAFLKVCGGG
jgi:dTDP-4-amino-4,6-dideoxygalactose transaminase